MKEKKEKNENLASNRRDFLRKGFMIGGGAVLGGTLSASKANTPVSGNTFKALTTDGKLIEVNENSLANLSLDNSPEVKSMREGVPGRKFVMVIDLSKCNNERKCQNGCREMHNLPQDVNWLKVFRMQDTETTAPYWMPAPCFHCDNPPCVKVCPVDATFIREDGIVLIDNERCIGCRFCMAACPYSARTFNWFQPEHHEGPTEHEVQCHNSKPRKIGTVEKCDFCTGELENGQLPKCVTSCPNGVFYIGDLNEDAVSNQNETVRFSELIASKGGYRLFEDLGTKPSVYYLPPANRRFPFKEAKEKHAQH